MTDHKQALGVADIAPLVARAQGCLLGQLADDALGSLVEFQSPATIRATYPNGVRELADGGCWNTIAGQPTDDSEMALALARTLAEHGTYSAKRARSAYERWLDSDPFDAGCTVTRGLTGDPNWDSEANGTPALFSSLPQHVLTTWPLAWHRGLCSADVDPSPNSPLTRTAKWNHLVHYTLR